MELGCWPRAGWFLSHNGGHLSIEFVDSFQNDTGEKPLSALFPPSKKGRLPREDRSWREQGRERLAKVTFCINGKRADAQPGSRCSYGQRLSELWTEGEARH